MGVPKSLNSAKIAIIEMQIDPEQKNMHDFRRQLEKGAIQKAYRALLAYMMSLRSHFRDQYPDFAVNTLYQGRMDVTFFAIFPPSLKRRDLKMLIVFNYSAFRFEIWLAGKNRKVSQKFWELLKDHVPEIYRVRTPAKGVYSIIEFDVSEDVDFGNPSALTSSIDVAVATFVEDLGKLLSDPKRP